MEDDSYDLPQIIEPESSSWNKEEIFSHHSCVTIAYHNAIRAGGLEMVKGYWEVKYDKWGNAMKTYHTDTRLAYISAVETLKNVLISNIDEEANNKLKILYKYLNDLTQNFIMAEEQHYNSLPPNSRNKFQHMKGFLNQDGIYYHQLVNIKVDVYRKIFEELELVLKRTKYLKKKIFVNTAEKTIDGLPQPITKIEEELGETIDGNLDEEIN